MGKESTVAAIFVGVVVGLLLVIFGAPIKDIITPPEAIPVAQYSEKFCPSNLYFYNNVADFSVKFQNIGDDGNLFVTLFSDKVLSHGSDDEDFKLNSTKIWIVNSKQYQDFSFKLSRPEEKQNFENFTVSLVYGCYEEVIGRTFNCKQNLRCCNYKKEYEPSFKLINQVCS